jgi:2'-deoxynucleoside 5'-phosphate N-hydrolase
MVMPKIYISGALTSLNKSDLTKSFYEAIGVLCQGMGFVAYVPHLNTDPVQHADVSPQKVFEMDKRQVSKADLVIAYVGVPSLGVGMELAYAEVNNIPIILLYEEGKEISRFPRGIPNVISEIQFNSYGNALTQLESSLKHWQLRSFELCS